VLNVEAVKPESRMRVSASDRECKSIESIEVMRAQAIRITIPGVTCRANGMGSGIKIVRVRG
jgi:hypothetical protein